ncbi:hypothetical protein LCGC14_2039860 [marine sediment metagenome]|uniref:Large polyvalent protein associated domain-containing protein n=1 Tax=marine sediment metagenome TaxID=412755 RepID=A0A0F9ES44_9ZZZZ
MPQMVGEDYVRGVLGTTNVAADIHPQDWSRDIHKIIPAGRAPFAAILTGMGSDPTMSKDLNWWSEPFPEQRGTITAIGTDADAGTAYTSGAIVGTPLYLKMSAADAEQIVDVFRPSFFVKGDEVTVLVNGKRQFYRVDPDLRDALLNLDRESMGMLGNFLSLPAKWLRAGATLSPDFMVRNPARDQLTSFVYSNYGFLPGVDFLRGLAGIIRKDADYQLFRQSGAEHSMMVSLDRLYLQKTFKEVVEGKKFKDYVKHPLELFQIVSELGEKATRLGEFKSGIRRGARPLEAGISAREVSLDFAEAGTTAHAVNRLIAFFNANIRGWDRMIKSFRDHPVRTSLKIFVGITLPSILLYLANRDDPRWKEIPQWQKDLFWIVMTEDTIYRIPKPFELGIIFGSMPERFLEWLDNKDPNMLKEVMLNMAEAGSPGYIPTALLPIIENLADFSFFRGRSIVPASRQDMPPEL